MRPQRLRLRLLVAILAAVTVASTAVVLAVLYRSSVEIWRQSLTDLVRARESLIDAAYTATGDEDETIRIVQKAQHEAPSIGTTGEFMVATREGGRIRFLIPGRYTGPTTVPAGGRVAEPMMRALAGEHRTMVGRDYRGATVLAAVHKVDGLPWGLVAKVDLAEVRTPFVHAFELATVVTALLITLGIFLFARITGPVIDALADSEQRFRAVFERSPVGKVLTSPDGRLLEVNQAFADLLGYAVEELPGLEFGELTHPDDVAASHECVRSLLSSERGAYFLRKRYLHRDGSVRWAEVSTTLLRDRGGVPEYFITVVVDVTERMRTQAELLAEKHFSEAMLASLPGVAYLFDRSLRFHRWNTNFERVTGYSHEEFAALSPLDLFAGPDRERVASRIAEVFESGASSVEAELLTTAGRRIPFLFTGRRVEIHNEVFLVGVGIDISARKRAEDRLAAANAELETRVAARTRELARTVEELAAANRELESFSYSVSHDLRAPLRAIDGFSRLLLEEHGAALPAEAARYLGIVRESTLTMGQLIDDLLAFSRVSRQELRHEPVELGDVVAEAWEVLAAEREGRTVELEVHPLPRVSGDRGLLKLVFVNLLGNAVKFTRKRERAHVEVGTQAENGSEVCYIRDNGAGFDMRYKDKLFGVFQRLHRTVDFEGTGVGLATVARIVERHGGRVWAEGEPDRGATFYLTLGEEADGTDQPG